MHTGLKLTDSTGTAWTVGKFLGQGAWGRTWLVRDNLDREAVLKAPPDDFADTEERAWVSKVRAEQLQLLVAGDTPWLPPLIATVDGHSWIIPRYSTSLAQALQEGRRLTELLQVIRDAAGLLVKGLHHGNLHPGNLFAEADGTVILTDPLTPSAASRPERLRGGWHPSIPGPGLAADPWALCGALMVAVRPGSAPGPMDKLELAALKDQLVARLKGEGANPRFVVRVAEKWGAVLRRGLSEQAEPSPPYRFGHTKDLHPRLVELYALLRPVVSDVGRVLYPSEAPDGVFRGPGPVKLSVSVNTTIGTVNHEDLMVGLRLVDLDSGERVSLEQAKFSVKPHPTGRLRFDIELPDVPPGRYDLETAFGVHGTPGEVKTSQASFEVRPPPGYVPPTHEPEPKALDFSRLAADARQVMREPEPRSRPGELVENPFARMATDPREPASIVDFDEPSTPQSPTWGAAPPTPAMDPPSVIPFPKPTGFEARDPDSSSGFPAPVAPTTSGRSPARAATPPTGQAVIPFPKPSLAPDPSYSDEDDEPDAWSDPSPMAPSDGMGSGVPTHPGEVRITLSVPPPPSRPTLAPGSTVLGSPVPGPGFDEPPTHPSDHGADWSGPGQWEDLPEPEALSAPALGGDRSLFSDRLGDDLQPLDELMDGPPSRVPEALRPVVDRLQALIGQDPMLLAGGAVAVMFLFAIFLILLTRGCA
ncbi:MAG: hypothetical protein JXX28_03270 [Deltaproteobacteria bacterium]|nr:hypothetical protein [Deltaproteobacteria bacterium]